MQYPSISKNTEWKILEKRNNIAGLNERISARTVSGKIAAADTEESPYIRTINEKCRYDIYELDARMKKLDAITNKWKLKSKSEGDEI